MCLKASKDFKEKRLKGFEEVELGFTREMAVAEAKRCLKCHEKE